MQSERRSWQELARSLWLGEAVAFGAAFLYELRGFVILYLSCYRGYDGLANPLGRRPLVPLAVQSSVGTCKVVDFLSMQFCSVGGCEIQTVRVSMASG